MFDLECITRKQKSTLYILGEVDENFNNRLLFSYERNVKNQFNNHLLVENGFVCG